jgi:hypothetical protein
MDASLPVIYGVRAAIPQSIARDRLDQARAMVRGLAGREG